MPKKKRTQPVLDLHHLEHEGFDLKERVYISLDRYIRRHHSAHSVIIITGRGLHSHTHIDGKHPILYYTMEYLRSTGYQFTYSQDRGCCTVYMRDF